MQIHTRFWSRLSTHDFSQLDAQRTVAVLPLGATEQHGPHLPLGVDTTLVDGVVDAALPHLSPTAPVYFLPTQNLGLSTEHTAFAGTLSVGPATLIELWCDIGAGVARSGVKKMVLFNAHGGNVGLMDVVARELRARHGLLVFATSWYQLPLGEAVMGLFSPHEQRFGVHAGAMETAMMLALSPQDVRMDQAQNFASAAETKAQRFAILGDGRSAKQGWMMQDYNPMGAAGHALSANAEHGRALVQAAGLQLARMLQEVVEHPPI
jgi:creatinine amidohydrolase